VLERAIGSVFAGYRIDRMIGRGGMGIVYLATQVALERHVALKLVAPELASEPTFRERFARELRFVAAIDHPHVIPVFDARDEEGLLFVAMRFVDGTDLRALILQEDGLEPLRAVRLVDQVAQALDAAHELGVVHRDVKPANVLIGQRRGADHVFLTDFGLSKHTTSGLGLTAPGQWVGTVDYVPPEQILGQSLDRRADIYALGCVLFEALTGRVPYPKEGDAAKLWAHMQDPPPSLAESGRDLPPALDDVVRRALAKDREERFPTAGELAEAAREAIAPATPTVIGASLPVSDPDATRITDAPEVTEEPAPDATHVPGAPPPSGAPATAGPTPTPTPAPSAPEAPPAAPPPPARPKPGGPRRRFGRAPLVAVAAVLVVAVAAAGFMLAGGSGGTGSSTVTVGGSPNAVAADGDAVWVLSGADGTVTRIAAADGKAGEPIEAAAAPTGVAAGEGAVWVAGPGEAVTRIDPSAGRADGEPIPVDSDAFSVAAGAGAVWVAMGLVNAVAVIDPGDRSTVDEPIDVGQSPEAIAVGEDAIWVANRDSATVSRIDPSERRTVGEAIQVGRGPSGLAVGGGSVWVANQDANTVTRIDADSGRVEGDAIAVGRAPVAVAVGGGSVWVANQDSNTVTRIDASSGRVVGEPIAVGPAPAGIAVAGGSVWVCNSGSNTVTRIEIPGD
jgi:YVTN family beta-propeller protein